MSVKKTIVFIVLCFSLIIACSDSSGDTDTEIKKTPVIFSNNQTSSLLLAVNDFPEGWTVKKKGSVISAEHVEFLTAKLLEMTLEIHDTETEANQFFSRKKEESQSKIEERGISGDELEDVKNYSMFVWMKDGIPNYYWFWEVIAVYGNVTLQVIHDGSTGCCSKDFAVVRT